MYVHDVGDGYGQTDHLCEARAQPVVDQHSGVLRVVPELDDVIIAVGAAHEMALRSTAHPADVLNGLSWHGGVPINSCGALTVVVSASGEAGLGLAFDGPDPPGCILYPRSAMKFQQFSFGQIRIDGIEYGYDVVIDRGKVGKRKKKASKKFRETFGHTPLSLEEKIPWKCRRLVVGTGEGALPVMDEVRREAKRRKIELLILPTQEAMKHLNRHAKNTNAILHVTC